MTEARKRVRPRKRTSPAAVAPAQSLELHNSAPTTETGGNGPPDEQAGGPVEDVRLDLLQIMLCQGRRQEEIAAYFGVTDRTIRNWKTQLATRTPRLLDQLDAKAEIAQIFYRFAAREDELLRWMRNAEAENDTKLMIAINKQLRGLQEERYRFLRELGAFVGFKLPTSAAGEQVHADLLLRMLGGFSGSLDKDILPDEEEV